MDTGEGRFVMLNDEHLRMLRKDDNKLLKKMYPKFGGVFQEGEIVELKGSKFEVSKIIQDGLKLRLLPKE